MLFEARDLLPPSQSPASAMRLKPDCRRGVGPAGAAVQTLLAFVERNCLARRSAPTACRLTRTWRTSATSTTQQDVSAGNDPAHVALPAVHRVASLSKRWLLGTHHGGCGAQHVEAYLDEFVFRFNRRQSNARGLLFYRLLRNAVALRKVSQELIVLRPRPQRTKRRGRKRMRPYSPSAITNTPAPRGT